MVYRTKKSGYKIKHNNKRNNKSRKLNNKKLRLKTQKVLKGGNSTPERGWIELLSKTEYMFKFTTSSNPMFKFTTSSNPENQLKNRYGNILAQESTRVKLNDNIGYINANYIYQKQKEGTDTSFDMFNKLIATQGPLDGTEKISKNSSKTKTNTIDDFWNMLEKENIDVVVMLCNLVEGEEIEKIKCGDYYTGNIEEESKVNDELGITKRILLNPKYTSQTQNKKYKTVQYHFTNWPDHGVPSDTSKETLYNLVKFIMDTHKNQNVVVHCSAGVGRTGTFIMMCYLYKYYIIDNSKKPLLIEDLVNKVLELRVLRNQFMVQTKAQFKFICEYNEYLQTESQQGQTIRRPGFNRKDPRRGHYRKIPSLSSPQPSTLSSLPSQAPLQRQQKVVSIQPIFNSPNSLRPSLSSTVPPPVPPRPSRRPPRPSLSSTVPPPVPPRPSRRPPVASRSSLRSTNQPLSRRPPLPPPRPSPLSSLNPQGTQFNKGTKTPQKSRRTLRRRMGNLSRKLKKKVGNFRNMLTRKRGKATF